MKMFSQDIVKQAQDFGQRIKTGAVNLEDEEDLQQQSHLAFLVSELPEDAKEELEQAAAIPQKSEIIL